MPFSKLGLAPHLLKAVKEKGFSTPTPIQDKSIPLMLEGKDIIGQAQTGTGKTAAYALPILQKLIPEMPVPQALVLVPTRELAVQVAKEFSALAKHSHVSTVAIYGGQDISVQLTALRKGVHVVIGTPGRIMDHLERRTIDFSQVSTVVLDEADRMLDMGFIDDVRHILSHAPKQRQTMLFSATMPNEIVELARATMHAPVTVKVSEDRLSAEGVDQYYASVDAKLKPRALAAIIASEKPTACLVFCRTKRGVDGVARVLKGYGLKVLAMHGNLTQNQRDKVMAAFRSGEIQVMVATDLAGRGLDMLNVSHVVNYNMPEDANTYVHRIGRTGRAGARGKSVTLVTSLFEEKELRSIAAKTDSEISELKFNMESAPSYKHVHEEESSDDRGGRGGYGRGYGGAGRQGGRGFGGRPSYGRSGGGGGRGGPGRPSGGYGRGRDSRREGSSGYAPEGRKRPPQLRLN